MGHTDDADDRQARKDTLQENRAGLQPAWNSRFDCSLAEEVHPLLDSVQGTPYYIAPEVLQREGSFVSDFFSLGVLAFRCYTGHMPFGGRTRGEVLQAIREGNVRWEHMPKSSTS